ncbi:1-acyl-sn-glycerol-3-phosphate acyltransferase [Rubrivirga sp. IMCC43871]|uniref:1-acyl-sn-glycerol-3-phosphate acyltransferase n=1 Tax=Rubrivirga sp. IMCC43871 TaxID=3391575 RepID=UPI00398FAA0A
MPAPTAQPLPTAALLPDLPPAVPRRGHPRWLRALGRWVFTAMGWRYAGGFADVPRMVLVGAPHTSNWDGLVGLAAAAWCDLSFAVFAKRQLFWGPLGWALRAFGGVPVDRSAPGGLVEQGASRLRGAGPAIVALTPEGTRSAAPRWKSGFHRIAVEAGVPIAVVGLDWGRREIRICGTLVPSGDLDADLGAIEDLLAGVEGRHPDRATAPTAGRAVTA